MIFQNQERKDRIVDNREPTLGPGILLFQCSGKEEFLKDQINERCKENNQIKF